MALQGGHGGVRTVWKTGARSVEVVQREVPEPAPGEVLIRVVASALCGSELPGYRAGHAGRNDGHEAAGEIVALGAGCHRLKVGDRVGVSAVQGCGACPECLAGRFTYCPHLAVYAGMHAEFIVSRELACHRLPDDVPWDEGVLLSGDGLGVPFHVARRLGDRTGKGALVCVFGVGPVGLGNVLVQSYLGADVVAVDISSPRLDLARQLGAVRTVQPPLTHTNHEQVRAEGRHIADLVLDVCGRAPDVCLDCAGRGETVLAALASVKTAGTVVCVGEQGPVPISPSEDLIHRDITLMGSWFYHFSEFGDMLALYRNGLPVSRLITHRWPLAEAAEAFRAFAAGETGKVLLRPS